MSADIQTPKSSYKNTGTGSFNFYLSPKLPFNLYLTSILIYFNVHRGYTG